MRSTAAWAWMGVVVGVVAGCSSADALPSKAAQREWQALLDAGTGAVVSSSSASSAFSEAGGSSSSAPPPSSSAEGASSASFGASSSASSPCPEGAAQACAAQGGTWAPGTCSCTPAGCTTTAECQQDRYCNPATTACEPLRPGTCRDSAQCPPDAPVCSAAADQVGTCAPVTTSSSSGAGSSSAGCLPGMDLLCVATGGTWDPQACACTGGSSSSGPASSSGSCAPTPDQVQQCAQQGGQVDPVTCQCQRPDAGPGCDPAVLAVLELLCPGRVDAVACTCGAGGPDAGMPGADGGSGAVEVLGQACGGDGECAGGTCIPPAGTRWVGGYCTLDCQSSAQCGTGNWCMPVNLNGVSSRKCLDGCDPAVLPPQCRTDYGCRPVTGAQGQVVGGVCYPACQNNGDCRGGTRCNLTSHVCE